MKEISRISAKQEKLIALLLTERTIEKACEKAGVASTTYWHWMQSASFLTEYRTARRGILENIVARMQSLGFSAIDTLEKNLNCENPSVEIRSAAIILEQSLKGVELLDLENRIAQMEAVMSHMEKNK